MENRADLVAGGDDDPSRTFSPPTGHSAEAIQAWLTDYLSTQLKVQPSALDAREPFVRYGLDSVTAVRIASELERTLERGLPPTVLYDYPTARSLALYLADREPSPAPTAGASLAPRPVDREPIAIIGIGCRFPGAKDPAGFWQLLRDGRDAVSEVAPSRWSGATRDVLEAVRAGEIRLRWGGFLDDVDQFDAEFFGISRARRRSWTRNKGCSSRSPGKPWKTPGKLPASRAAGRVSSSGSARGTTRSCRWGIPRRRIGLPASATR